MPRLNIPPAPTPRDNFGVLEIGDADTALALWHALHKVILWARTPAERRKGLFRPLSAEARARHAAVAASVPLLADPLSAFLALHQAPGEVQPERIGRACYLVWEWADRCGWQRAATAFAEAAAYAHPDSPTFAVVAGYMTRTCGGAEMLARSDAWHQRARVLAIQRGDREEAVRAQTGMGALMKDLGAYEEARRHYTAAVRRARRTGRKRRAAVVQHYLFALSAEVDDAERAASEAAKALALYPLHDERLPALAHDFAYLLIRERYYRTALRLVDQLGERVEGPFATGMLLGITARAAAGAGRLRRSRTAERAALNVARISDACAGAVHVNLAEAARLAGRVDDARAYAVRALELARPRADVEVERLARGIIEALDRGEPLPAALHPPPTPIATVARRIAARLSRWRRHNRGAGIIQ